jgi:hypothetical protein
MHNHDSATRREDIIENKSVKIKAGRPTAEHTAAYVSHSPKVPCKNYNSEGKVPCKKLN